MYIGLCVKYPWFLSDFNETLIFWTYLEKYSNTKFMKLIVAFRNFVNTPENEIYGQRLFVWVVDGIDFRSCIMVRHSTGNVEHSDLPLIMLGCYPGFLL
jgi:hypothetical protein